MGITHPSYFLAQGKGKVDAKLTSFKLSLEVKPMVLSRGLYTGLSYTILFRWCLDNAPPFNRYCYHTTKQYEEH
jgi:hypothetical protein